MSFMPVGEYLSLVEDSYSERGGIKHQRTALKTTSGRRIRQRLVADICMGAVLPPLVLGVVSDVEGDPYDFLLSLFVDDAAPNISIIDGMQRTTALLEAIEVDASVKDRIVRVEWWITKNTESLIYRMLVLNTGQTPWNLQKQLQVVFDALVREMQKRINFIRLLRVKEDEDRRANSGEFSASDLVECYMAFGLRKTEFDTKEQLADEFSRLDVADAIASEKYSRYFYPIIQLMVDLDIAFSKFDAEIESERKENSEFFSEHGSVYKGRNIFDAQAARIGFVVACAIQVMGRTAMDKEQKDSDAVMKSIDDAVCGLISRLDGLSYAEHRQFMCLDILSEKRSGQRQAAVGRQQRSLYENAFSILIETGPTLPSMETCWRG